MAGATPRVREAPYLRGVGILSVIATHAVVYYRLIQPVNSTVVAYTVVNVFVHLGVPLFLFASGILLAVNYSGPFSVWRFYRRRAAVLIPPYLIFTTIYLAYDAWASGRVPSALRVLYDFVTGDAFYHLWFIPLIAQLYLVYPFLVWAFERRPLGLKAWQIVLGMVILQSLYSAFVLWYHPIARSGVLSYLARGFFLSNVGYFAVGMHAGRNLDVARAWLARLPTVPVAGVSLAAASVFSVIWIRNNVLFGGFYAAPPSYSIPTAILEPILYLALFALFLRWAGTANSRIVARFGEYSLWIYLVHPLLIVPQFWALSRLGIDSTSWLLFPMVFAITSALCLLSTYLVAPLPHRALIGGPGAGALRA